MKKFVHLALLFIIIPLLITAQQQQFENPGFEEWEDAGTVREEPVDWSSIKTSNGGTIMNQAAPLVWDKSTDHHTGNYSLKLFNVATFGIVATGTATNGRVHPDFDPTKGFVFTEAKDPQWHTPFSSRPDSLVGWFKQYPVDDDFGRVRVVLHVDSARLPENGTFQNWIAEALFYMPQQEVNEWTRFSVPFTYYSADNPTHILAVLNSGNGTEPVEGSEAYFDDLELIYNPEGYGETLSEDAKIFIRNNIVYIHLISAEKYKYIEMQIFDISGKLVYSKALPPNSSNAIPTSLTSGFYLCRVISDRGSISRKLYIR